jgi:hypothetical protein
MKGGPRSKFTRARSCAMQSIQPGRLPDCFFKKVWIQHPVGTDTWPNSMITKFQIPNSKFHLQLWFNMRRSCTGVGKCPNWTSPNYWGYNHQQILESDVKQIPKTGHLPTPVVSNPSDFLTSILNPAPQFQKDWSSKTCTKQTSRKKWSSRGKNLWKYSIPISIDDS